MLSAIKVLGVVFNQEYDHRSVLSKRAAESGRRILVESGAF